MFEVHDRTTRRNVTVYAVHKSGPMDNQTKFLVHDGGWRWAWATQFEPLEATARREAAERREAASRGGTRGLRRGASAVA